MAKLYEYDVTGTYTFPVDMLRYDAAWPRDTESALEIVNNEFEGDSWHTKRIVHLRSYHQPTDARWRSFSWHVIPGSLRKVG